MSSIETKPAPERILTIEERASIVARAKADPGAIDEVIVALDLESNRAVKAERRIETLQRQVDHLEHRLAVLLQRTFGRSSEKIDPAQLKLFMDQIAATTATETPPATPTEETAETRKKRKGHGRDKFPPHIPRREIRLDPDPSKLQCAECDKALRRIREEITERGGFIPGYWEIFRYIRGVWACSNGCGSVEMAELPPALVAKSRFEPSVAVQTAIAKFGDHMPIERQSGMHARLGVEIAPSTLVDNVDRLAALHGATVAQMEAEVVAEKHLHVDDTPVVVLVDTEKVRDEKVAAEARAKNQKKVRLTARVWVYVALSGKLFFKFTDDRSRDGPGGPKDILSRFLGCLICDEYAGFDKICKRLGMMRAACWAHCRRKIRDALDEDRSRSARLLLMIHRLFWIEAAAKLRRKSERAFGDADMLALRQRRSRVVVDQIMTYGKNIKNDVLPSGALGTALTYLLGNEDHLRTFLDDPCVPVDNNAAERGLRAIALGRKNYLHFGSLEGGDTAAVLYSLIGSCKALGLNSYAYLLDTTKTLLANPATPRSQLTPWAWAEARAAKMLQAAPQPPAATT